MHTTRDRFFMKTKLGIEPVGLLVDPQAVMDKLSDIRAKHENRIPIRYLEKWDEVCLYHPKGDLDKANAILLPGDPGAYSLNNRLNELNGRDWTRFTCSWFVFNALPADLKEERAFSAKLDQHPATFSPSMIREFIEFFTKSEQLVFDPFMGIGSTAVAAKRSGRVAYGIELKPEFCDLARKRVPEFAANIILGSAEELSSLRLPQMDFSISSPPYWDVLNRSTGSYRKDRNRRGLATNYSDSDQDLGNVTDYQVFLDRTASVYEGVFHLLRPGAYCVIIVKNVKKEGKLYPLAWDLARRLGDLFDLKDERIWIQDKGSLAPYGYPFAWVSNILHHYCLVLQKPV